MKKRLMYLILPIITLFLEILPYGAVCNFANPEGEIWRKTFSYFDLIPFGNANFSPFITAINTCVIIGFVILYLLSCKYIIIKITKYLLLITIVFSICPLLLGVNYFSFIGAAITITLIAEFLFLHISIKK